MYLNARNRVKAESERRSIFLRYLKEVAGAVATIQDLPADRQQTLYDQLLHVARRKTAEADTRFDERGRKVQEALELGEHVLIVGEAAGEGEPAGTTQ
jgi:DNA topoisomerase-6 subunit B